VTLTCFRIEARNIRGTETDGATNYFVKRKGKFIYGKQNIFRGAIGIIPKELFSIKINLPPLKEPINVAQCLDFANCELDQLKELVEKYKLQKRGLMQKLFTGQWRVKPEIVQTFAEENR